MAAALLAVVLAQLAAAQPAISFPFNSQLPPAARIGKFFSFTLSPLTFTSPDSDHVSYALGKHPDWLSLGSDGLRLYGTPKDTSVPKGRVVGQPVEIIATDGQGPTTMKATVVVSRDPPPAIRLPISKQIGGFGKFSAPSSVLSYPDTAFKFSFDRDTFGGKPLNHYATSGDGSPLPAWVSFDNSSMTFSGKTPPFKSLVQPPQAFDLRLVASDIVGFAAASINFAIIVGSHNLTTEEPVVSLRASWGSKLVYDGFEHGIRLDDKPVAPSDLTVTTNRLPPWLTLDTATGKLEGTPGPGDHSTSFTVSFHDPFSDTLDVEVTVHVDTSLFESTVEDMEARPDSRIDVDLAKYFRHPDDVDVQLTTNPKQDWLKAHRLRISGHVPKTAKGDFQVSILAKSKKSTVQETEKFGVAILALDGSTTVPAGPTGTGRNHNNSNNNNHNPTDTTSPSPPPTDSEPNRLSTGEIMLATIIPIIFISVLLMLLVCYVRRRRARQAYMSGGKGGRAAAISPPMAIGPNDPTDSDSTMDNVVVVSARAEKQQQHYKPTRGAVVKKASSRRRSSDTLGPGDDSDSGFSAGTQAAYDGRQSMTVRSVGSSECDRRSWITIEGDDAASITAGSAASHMSDTTFSESTHQLLPAVDSLHEPIVHDFRSGLDMTIPTMEPDQPTPLNIYKRSGPSTSTMATTTRQSLGAHSIQTSSSVALPSTLGRNWGTQRSMSNWETIAESEDVVDDGASSEEAPRRPDRALLGDDARRRQWYDDESPRIAGGGGGGNDDDDEEDYYRGMNDSFTSSENWRVIGPRTGRQSSTTSIGQEGRLPTGKTQTTMGSGSFKVFV